MPRRRRRPDAAATPENTQPREMNPVGVEREVEVRRMPKMGVFLALGALIGLILSLILAFGVPAREPTIPGVREFSQSQVFGFVALFLVPISMGVTGLIGSLLGRRVGTAVVRRLPDEETQDAAAGADEAQAAASSERSETAASADDAGLAAMPLETASDIAARGDATPEASSRVNDAAKSDGTPGEPRTEA